MMLYDEIMRRPPDALPDDTFQLLKKAVCFNIDNVADYFWSQDPNRKLGLRDFPDMVPVFDVMWLEYSNSEFFRGSNRMRRFGALWESQRDEDKWIIYSDIFTMTQHETMWLGIKWVTWIAADRMILDSRREFTHPNVRHRSDDDVEKIETFRAMVEMPGWMALSFMHCKNVEVIENKPPALPMTKKRAQHPPRTTFYTLNIKPMQRILEEEGQASKTGLKMALHICRGHFKDYSNGGGLFGKYKGMYWWESQVRGDKKYGEVIKDYRVQPQ